MISGSEFYHFMIYHRSTVIRETVKEDR